MVAVISSIKDEHLALVRALAGRAGRLAAGCCVLEGGALVDAALSAGTRPRFAIAAAERRDESGLAGRLADAGVPVFEARESLLRQVLKTHRPVTWVAVAAFVGGGELPAERDQRPYGRFAVVLDHVADPGNLGAIVRTAVGLGALDVVCLDDGTDLTSRKVLDASRAAALRARVRRFDSLDAAFAALRQRGFQIVATSSHAPVEQARVALRGGPVALVVGNETHGVSPRALELADQVARIPMASAMESLNVAVATGISLYELRERAESAATDADGAAELAVTLAQVGAAASADATAFPATALAGFSEAERAAFAGYLARARENLRRAGTAVMLGDAG